MQAGAYDDTALTKVLPGRFLLLGTQGPKRSGLVQAPAGLAPNPDLLSPAAFRLRHLRPGTVSLNLSGVSGVGAGQRRCSPAVCWCGATACGYRERWRPPGQG